MGIFRFAGRAMTALSLLLVAVVFLTWLDGKKLSRSGGEIWVLNDPTSYSNVQRGIQQYLSPDLWDDAAVPFLELPAWQGTGIIVATLMTMGIFLMIVARKNPKKDKASTTGGG